MSEYKIYVIGDRKVELKTRKKFPYYDIISLLLQGEDIFIEVNRKMAYYLKKRLNEMLNPYGLEVEAYPSVFEGMEGYTFRIPNIPRSCKFSELEKLKGEIQKLLERAEGELKFIQEQPPDRTLTKAKHMLKTRIETLKEILALIERIEEEKSQ